MKINSIKENGHIILELDGELDASSAIVMDTELAKARSNDENSILVDFKKLNYISSAGLGVFMSYIKDFEENGINLVIFNVKENVKKVFNILGLDNILKIVETKEKAKAMG